MSSHRSLSSHRRCEHRRRRRGFKAAPGFTLLELLVAAGLVAIVAGALLAAFSGGVRVWERARSWDEAFVQAMVGLEQMERDIRNAAASRFDRFEGDESHIVIPSVVKVAGKAGFEEWPGVIRYEPGAAKGTMECRAIPRETKGEASVSVVMSSVENVRFGFCSPGGSANAGIWMSSWAGRSNLPAAVRINVQMDTGSQPRTLERIVVLPTR